MRVASYHNHTTFCDGQNSPEEMAVAAIEAGITDFGFSAHASWFFSSEWNLDARRYPEYLAEIARLKAKYREEIRIFAGFEADYLPGISVPDPAIYGRFSPDFLIGSIHYIHSDKKDVQTNLWPVDAGAEAVGAGLEECFDNDGRRAARAYWSAVRAMVRTCRFDIIGHLDLLRKRNGILHFFDESELWYRRELAKTVKVIARSKKIVELNTGAIARKAMDGVYPSDELLSLLYKAGVPVTISADAHSTDNLLCAYEKAREAARRAGYTTLSYLNPNGWVQEKF